MHMSADAVGFVGGLLGVLNIMLKFAMCWSGLSMSGTFQPFSGDEVLGSSEETAYQVMPGAPRMQSRACAKSKAINLAT